MANHLTGDYDAIVQVSTRLINGLLATLNQIEGASHDVWSVNTKAEYLEEGPLAEDLADLDLVA